MGVRRLWRYRAVRFGVVAASCTLGQLLVLAWLTRLGVSEVVANGIGFVLSAQANFVLSAQITWRDRKHPVRSADFGAWPARWVSFNTVAIAALAINELVLQPPCTRVFRSISDRLLVSEWRVVTFSVNHFITFGDSGRKQTETGMAEHRPSLARIRAKVQEEGVAFLLPAFNEAQNLRILVPKLVNYFHFLNCPFTVVIVNDGSAADDTYETAERMADAYPGCVRVVHHSQNLGYGAGRSDRTTHCTRHSAMDLSRSVTPTYNQFLHPELRHLARSTPRCECRSGCRLPDRPGRLAQTTTNGKPLALALDPRAGLRRCARCGLRIKVFTREALIGVVPTILRGAMPRFRRKCFPTP